MAPYAGIGARATPPPKLALMTRIARALAAKDYVLRSGHAQGADSAFEAGAGEQAEIYLPARAWQGSASPFHPQAIDPAIWQRAEAVAAAHHPAWARLSPFVRALQTRNSFQVLGRDLAAPARFVLCWTADGEASGGTGQAIRIAETHRIPVINLQREAHRAHVLDQLGL